MYVSGTMTCNSVYTRANPTDTNLLDIDPGGTDPADTLPALYIYPGGTDSVDTDSEDIDPADNHREDTNPDDTNPGDTNPDDTNSVDIYQKSVDPDSGKELNFEASINVSAALHDIPRASGEACSSAWVLECKVQVPKPVVVPGETPSDQSSDAQKDAVKSHRRAIRISTQKALNLVIQKLKKTADEIVSSIQDQFCTKDPEEDPPADGKKSWVTTSTVSIAENVTETTTAQPNPYKVHVIKGLWGLWYITLVTNSEDTSYNIRLNPCYCTYTQWLDFLDHKIRTLKFYEAGCEIRLTLPSNNDGLQIEYNRSNDDFIYWKSLIKGGHALIALRKAVEEAKDKGVFD
jgi:hypothetical protein